MKNRELSRAVSALAGTMGKRIVIGNPDETVAADSFDGYNPFLSVAQAREYLAKKRSECQRGSCWDTYDVWIMETFPDYCTDMGLCWALVEEMGLVSSITLTLDSSRSLDENRTEYRLNSDDGVVRGSLNHSSTMERAVCKAYVAWREGLAQGRLGVDDGEVQKRKNGLLERRMKSLGRE